MTTIERANDILESSGIRNTTDSDRGNYLAYQLVRGVVCLCDCNTCTPVDLDEMTDDEIMQAAEEWLDAVA